VTDPLLEPIEHARLVRSTLGSARVRSIAIALVGAVLLLVFASRLGGPLVDEMPLLVLALWALIVAGGVYLAQLEPAGRRRL
jgi:hypothetical protein